jgi:hypothetical protein
VFPLRNQCDPLWLREAQESAEQQVEIKRQRETVDDETKNVNKMYERRFSDSDRHATNYDDEWLTVNA